jgi:hypothetical protein
MLGKPGPYNYIVTLYTYVNIVACRGPFVTGTIIQRNIVPRVLYSCQNVPIDPVRWHNHACEVQLRPSAR